MATIPKEVVPVVSPSAASQKNSNSTQSNNKSNKYSDGFSKYNQLKIEEFWLYRMYDGKASDKDKWIDIRPFHLELNIFEDLTVQTLSAQLIISDAANLPDRFPIVGGERVKIKYKSTAEEESKELVFVVYKIGERKKSNDQSKNQSYVLFLCTEDRWLDSNLDISKAYSGTYSSIVKDCLNELQTIRPLDAEESETNCGFISPYWSPLRSVKFCAKRAINSKQSPFIFWETMNGYNFKSISSIYAEVPFKSIYIEPRLHKANIESLEKSLNTVIRFEFKESNNKLEQYSNGTYGSRIFYFDIGTKKVELAEIDYRNSFKESESHIEEFPLTDDMANVRKKNTIAISMNDGSHKSKYIRNMILDHIANYKVLVHLPGDTNINAGKTLYFEIPAMSNMFSGYQKEVLTSGKWLIASVRHRIGRETYDAFAELIKDSHKVDIQESVYGKTKEEINEEDIKRKEIPTEVMPSIKIDEQTVGTQNFEGTEFTDD